MPPIEAKISTIKGEVVAKVVLPEQPGDYPVGHSTLTISEIIPGKRNGQPSIKALKVRISPPYSDGREQRFVLNGKPSEVISPEAENNLADSRFKARLRVIKK